MHISSVLPLIIFTLQLLMCVFIITKMTAKLWNILNTTSAHPLIISHNFHLTSITRQHPFYVPFHMATHIFWENLKRWEVGTIQNVHYRIDKEYITLISLELNIILKCAVFNRLKTVFEMPQTIRTWYFIVTIMMMSSGPMIASLLFQQKFSTHSKQTIKLVCLQKQTNTLQSIYK